MKTDIDIKDDVYIHLKNSSLPDAVTGKLVKTLRPKGSSKEDICINVLANQNAEVQEAFVNVNIYVADILVNGQYEENSPRLRELCTKAAEVLGLGKGEGYRFIIDSQRVLESEDLQGHPEHIINTKILYKNINS